ncbi:LysM peptidoglycan-binding domain-containing protein [Aeromicrobium sp. CF4.19]|uniref:LysM peptidoglycan-binding domain-containing protein n=1 Tax=Aeromicrobium sp. CF4.19 TaxID=3373082 RepID=UPI003EE71F6D
MSTISLTSYPSFSSPELRLTRRGRLVVLLAALVALVLLAVAFGPSVTATGERGDVPATTVVTVQPGETLWQIAGDANPAGDPRETVDDIMRMNSLSGAGELQMGRELAVPVYE